VTRPSTTAPSPSASVAHPRPGIDVVISKTVVYAVLAAFITAVYVLLVVGIGRLAGFGGRPAPSMMTRRGRRRC
jgi:hypothetical protein